MRRVKLKNYAEVTECNENMVVNTYLRQVLTDNPNRFPYKVGTISLKYYCISEIFYNGKISRSVMNENPRTYYFGDFVSVDDLISQNVDGRYDALLIKIKEHERITGIVTNPEGFTSMVQENDSVIEPKKEKPKVKSKKNY